MTIWIIWDEIEKSHACMHMREIVDIQNITPPKKKNWGLLLTADLFSKNVPQKKN